MILCYLVSFVILLDSVYARYLLSGRDREVSSYDNVRNLWSYHYDKYLSFPEMEDRLQQLERAYPDLVSLRVVGQSIEKRNLYLVTVSSKVHEVKKNSQEASKDLNSEDEKTPVESSHSNRREGRRMPINFNSGVDTEEIVRVNGIEAKVRQDTSPITGRKPVIFVDGGIHAREWASPSAALYIIDQVIKDPALHETIEWRIMPIVNPDGYAFSSISRSKRFWRKNRRNTSNPSCYGVDLNRNFDVDWKNTIKSPCSVVYGGTRAFSEPESRALRDSINEGKDVIKAYVTIHSFGQYILYPYGYSRTHQPDNLAELKSMANGMAQEVFKAYKSNYKVGSASILGAASGGSDDWAHMKAKIPYSILIEMRPQSGRGLQGFDLPTSELQQAVDEVWKATNYLAQTIKLQYSTNDLRSELLHSGETFGNTGSDASDKSKPLNTKVNPEDGTKRKEIQDLPSPHSNSDANTFVESAISSEIVIKTGSSSDEFIREENGSELISDVKIKPTDLPSKETITNIGISNDKSNEVENLKDNIPEEFDSLSVGIPKRNSIKVTSPMKDSTSKKVSVYGFADDKESSFNLPKDYNINSDKEISAMVDSGEETYPKVKAGIKRNPTVITKSGNAFIDIAMETGSSVMVKDLGKRPQIILNLESSPKIISENTPKLGFGKENIPAVISNEESTSVSKHKTSSTDTLVKDSVPASSSETGNNIAISLETEQSYESVPKKDNNLAISTDIKISPTAVSVNKNGIQVTPNENDFHKISSDDQRSDQLPLEKDIPPVVNSEILNSPTVILNKGTPILLEKESELHLISEKENNPEFNSKKDSILISSKLKVIPKIDLKIKGQNINAQKDTIPLNDADKQSILSNSEESSIKNKHKFNKEITSINHSTEKEIISSDKMQVLSDGASKIKYNDRTLSELDKKQTDVTIINQDTQNNNKERDEVVNDNPEIKSVPFISKNIEINTQLGTDVPPKIEPTGTNEDSHIEAITTQKSKTGKTPPEKEVLTKWKNTTIKDAGKLPVKNPLVEVSIKKEISGSLENNDQTSLNKLATLQVGIGKSEEELHVTDIKTDSNSEIKSKSRESLDEILNFDHLTANSFKNYDIIKHSINTELLNNDDNKPQSEVVINKIPKEDDLVTKYVTNYSNNQVNKSKDEMVIYIEKSKETIAKISTETKNSNVSDQNIGNETENKVNATEIKKDDIKRKTEENVALITASTNKFGKFMDKPKNKIGIAKDDEITSPFIHKNGRVSLKVIPAKLHNVEAPVRNHNLPINRGEIIGLIEENVGLSRNKQPESKSGINSEAFPNADDESDEVNVDLQSNAKLSKIVVEESPDIDFIDVYDHTRDILDRQVALKLEKKNENLAFPNPTREGIPLSIWCRRIKNSDMCSQLM